MIWVTLDLLPENDSVTRSEDFMDLGINEFVVLTMWTSAPQSMIVVGAELVVVVLIVGGGFGGGRSGGVLSLSENPGGRIVLHSTAYRLGSVLLRKVLALVHNRERELRGSLPGGDREDSSGGVHVEN